MATPGSVTDFSSGSKRTNFARDAAAMTNRAPHGDAISGLDNFYGGNSGHVSHNILPSILNQFQVKDPSLY